MPPSRCPCQSSWGTIEKGSWIFKVEAGGILRNGSRQGQQETSGPVCNNLAARLCLYVSPTIIREGGVLVMIYSKPREHDPPHVHVVKAGGEARIALGDARSAPMLWDYTMRRSDVAQALRIVDEHQAVLLAEWE